MAADVMNADVMAADVMGAKPRGADESAGTGRGLPFWYAYSGRKAPASSVLRILERAIEVIEEGGEVAIRTNAIAHQCGVTAPILYRAFGSREGLVVAAQAERYYRTFEGATQAFSDLLTGAESGAQVFQRFNQFLDVVLDNDRRHLRRIRAEVMGSSQTRPELREIVSAIDRKLSEQHAAVLSTAQAAGLIEPKVGLRMAVSFCSALISARLGPETALSDYLDENDLDEWDRLTRESVLRIIFGDRIYGELADSSTVVSTPSVGGR